MTGNGSISDTGALFIGCFTFGSGIAAQVDDGGCLVRQPRAHVLSNAKSLPCGRLFAFRPPWKHCGSKWVRRLSWQATSASCWFGGTSWASGATGAWPVVSRQILEIRRCLLITPFRSAMAGSRRRSCHGIRRLASRSRHSRPGRCLRDIPWRPGRRSPWPRKARTSG